MKPLGGSCPPCGAAPVIATDRNKKMMNLMQKAGYPIYLKLLHVSCDLWSESGQNISVTFNLFQSFFMHLYTNFASLHRDVFNLIIIIF